ncbi:casein kinase II beta 2 subunit [Colletotrichum tofieldiae]|nr:casein kinase II beta 2 subunit [Colletotrichum tofieldiae]
MSVAGGIWAPAALRLLRMGITKTTKVIRTKLANATRPAVQGEFAHIPSAQPAASPSTRPHFSDRSERDAGTQPRAFTTPGPSTSGNASSARFSRASFPSSNTARRVGQSTGRAPFASTLRPNLTGGAIARTQGGYTLGGGGGARYFSHTPAAPAQVIQNVSVAMRAFCLSGQKVRYDGLNGRGDKRYRAVSELEQAAYVKMMSASARGNPGSFIDFHISPTVTALSPWPPPPPRASPPPTSRPRHHPERGRLSRRPVDRLCSRA